MPTMPTLPPCPDPRQTGVSAEVSAGLRAEVNTKVSAAVTKDPPAVPRSALVLALVAVTATYFFLDRPAATAGQESATVGQLVSAPPIKSAPVSYYMFINPVRLVYEE